MTTPEDPWAREPRAVDGLDWRARPSAPEPLTPAAEAPTRRLPAAAATNRTWPLLAATFVLGGLAGALGGVLAAVIVDDDSDNPARTAEQGGQTALTVELTDAISSAATKVRPSVVLIEATLTRPGGTVREVGSGIMFDREGHILTNAHVVLGTDTLKVVLPDGTERTAILLGHDSPFTDLAVLQIGPSSVPPIELGSSKDLRLGQTVVAIGNALGELQGSVTVGVVSGLNRPRTYDAVAQPDLIQTDAPLNQGNSGGALVNLQGQLVGMPTIILRESASGHPVEGVGFALPSDRVVAVARRIIAEGRSYPRPALGIEHVDLSPEVAARLRVGLQDGALVTEVLPAGPAAAAGIARGDVIVKVGAQDVNRRMPFLNVLAEHNPGDTVRVVFSRGGRIIEADVKLALRG